MKLLKKYKVLIVAAVVLVGVFYWLFAEDTTKPIAPPKIDTPNAVVKGNTLVEEKDGKKVWELTVDEIEIDSKNNENILRGVKGKLYRENGSIIEVIAKGGNYSVETRKMVLKGDIVVVYSEGWELKCQEMMWVPEDNLILAKEKVEFKKDDLFVTGDQVETDRELLKIKVTGNGVVKKGG